MPCYRPNIILVDKEPTYHGQKAKILQFINSTGASFIGYEYYDRQNAIYEEMHAMTEFQKIPCGECAGCQETYSKGWAIRCMKEAELYTENYFITLTYDDEHLPKEDEIVDRQTGVIYERTYYDKGYLNDSDLSKFIKDTRRYWSYHYSHKGIRFFACGEYGSITRRPHYHAILFNLPLDKEKMKIYKVQANGTTLYNYDELEKIWGKGHVVIGEVNWDTCAYVARYVMKKSGPRKRREDYFKNGETPEFIRMSRKPGIGREFYDQNKEKIYENDEIITKGHKEKISACKPPAYYDKLFDVEKPKDMQKIKEKRKEIAKDNNKIQNNNSTMTVQERLRVAGESKSRKWRTLKRGNTEA